MGGSPSVMIKAEMDTWKKAHSLEIDSELRARQLRLVGKFGEELCICWFTIAVPDFGGKPYRHYFITDGTLAIMFGRSKTVAAHVEVGPLPFEEGTYEREKTFACDAAARQRLASVCGARGHSFCLRNSEHMCKYIATGSWVSRQMFPSGLLMAIFQSHMGKSSLPAINTLPVEMQSVKLVEPVFPEMKPWVALKQTRNSLTQAEVSDNRAYNIVLFGPTGCGKSHLINMLYNRTVCPSVADVSSVTRHMVITQGTALVSQSGTTALQERPVNIIDSIGFCDSELSPSEVMTAVKQHIKANFLELDKIVMVCSGRLEDGQETAMRQVMKWLRYKEGNHPYNFVLIYNKCDGLDEAKREELLAKMCTRLDLSTSSLEVSPTPCMPSTTMKGQTKNRVSDLPLQVAVGFPPSASYETIEKDYMAYLDTIFHTYDGRVRVDPSRECTLL